MMMTQFRTVISLVLIQCAVSMRPLITCETPGSVNEGLATFLTCNYNRDLSRTKQEFYVYKVHNDTREPVIVTLCKWDNNAWSCDTDDSYKVLTADINNQVIVEIPSAKQSLSGTYFCKTLSVDTNSTHRGCNLTVRSAGKGGTELGWSVVPTPYIVFACVVAVLLVVASVLLIRNHSVVSQWWTCACKCEPRYNILKDHSKPARKDIFAV